MFEFIDNLLYLLFSLPVLYLVVFALFSLPKKKDPAPSLQHLRKMAVLVPAYREDSVIEDTVNAILSQQYPKEQFDVVVISDKMREETNTCLSKRPIRLIQLYLEKSSKAIAIRTALEELSGYDIAIVLDADNIIEPLFLQKINGAFSEGTRVVQAHRKAKNTNTNFAFLDAISEEINNSIFRKGHVIAGFSSALIGSGMAFEFDYYKTLMGQIESISGEDKELEHRILLQGIKIDYLEHAIVLDEKIQRSKDFSNQRKRWLSAQFEMVRRFVPQLPTAIKNGEFSFCDKVLQMILPPRVILLGCLFLISIVTLIIDLELAEKWITLFALLLIALMLSIPLSLYNRQFLIALLSLPKVFVLMGLNLFRLKGASKQFIHTPHGIDQ